jgi:hypothetical protein
MVIMRAVRDVTETQDREPKRPAQEVLTISIRFKADLVQALRELAEEENRSFNGTVNEACKRFVRQRRPRTASDGADGR